MSGHAGPFRWQLLPLQRKLEAELEVAKASLRRLLKEAADARAAVAAMHERVQAGAASARREWDPQLHACQANWVADGASRLEPLRVRRREAHRRLVAARDECVRRRQQLEALLGMRDAQRRQHRVLAGRRDAAAADDAWLVTCRHLAPEPGREP